MTTPQRTKRIGSIDGLKGLAAVFILVFHYLLAFAPYGHIGFGSGVAKQNAEAVYMASFPYSILVSTPFALYIFFALIAFIPALRYMKTGDAGFLYKQATVRYVRLMPPTLVAALLGYIGYACFAGQHTALVEAMRPLTGGGWLNALVYSDLSLGDALQAGLWKSLCLGDARYNSPLWCMSIVLFGSYAVYAVLLTFGKLQRRWIIYLILAFVCVAAGASRYLSFLAGIAAADFSRQAEPGKHSEACALSCVALAILIAIFPSVLLPSFLDAYTMQGIACFFFLFGMVRSAILEKMLGRSRTLKHLGKLSFGILLVQFPVLLYFSAWVYTSLVGCDWSYPGAATVSFLISLPLVYVLSLAFYYAVEVPCGKLCNLIYALFAPAKQPS